MKRLYYIVLSLVLFAFTLHAQQSVLKVTVKEKQTIRDVAKEYLNDPDLWEEILKGNKLKSPSDVKTGMVLTIPYNQIMRCKKAVDEALAEIQKATNSGAKSFAPDQINKAISLHTQSLKERKSGNWDKSFQLATEAKQEAINAAQEANMKSAAKGEAMLSYAKGKVESKKAIENLWKSILLYSKFIENDRVRTLSDSYAEVAFQDKSKIRLSENSQAVIQKNRVDLLNNRSEAKVTLEKGDAFALLAGGASGKKKFNLEVPGLETTVRSKAYWVNKDEKSAKVANYDGELELKSKNSKVTLKTNQGSSLLASGTLTQPKDLLKKPGLIAPAPEKITYANKVSLEWSKIDGADKYWVMISRDATFKTTIEQSKDHKNTSFETELERGSYYWRVAAIDKEGFPGPFSEARIFTLVVNNEPPFLSVAEPATDAFVTKSEFTVKGSTESLVKVMVNDEQVIPDANGAFEKAITLQVGINTVTVTAVDSSGNKASITRKIEYSKGRSLFLNYDMDRLTPDKHFYTTSQSVTVKGKTTPETFISVVTRPLGLRVSALSDNQGDFQFTINKLSDQTTVLIEAKNKEQQTISDTLFIIRDQDLPELTFKDDVPEKTSDNTLTILGTISHATSLRLNGAVIDIREGKFQTVYTLKEGLNELLFIAVNKNGAKTKIYRKVILDTTPPELISQKVNPAKFTGQALVTFEVKAADKTELKKTVKIVYQLGEDLYTEYLPLDEANMVYRGVINCSNAGLTEVKVRLILLEDQLGNMKEYNFFNQELKK